MDDKVSTVDVMLSLQKIKDSIENGSSTNYVESEIDMMINDLKDGNF